MGNQYKEWTKEEIIKAIQDFNNRHQKTPRGTDFRRENKLPSYRHTLEVLGCTRIQDILNLCGLTKTKTVYPNEINPDSALIKLREYYQLLGKIPTREDFKHNKFEISHTYYCRHFGNYENACYLAGLAEQPLTDEERIKISVDQLINLANKLQKCPTVSEYDLLEHRGFGRRELERKLGIKYAKICKKYVPQYKVNVDWDVTKETILEIMKTMLEEHGGAMTYDEMKENGLTYSHSIFESKCHMTFNQIISYLGYVPVGSTTAVRTKEVMLKDFYDYFLKLKRIPYFNDLNNNPDIASSTTYISHFGSIENICNLLNIDYKKYYKGSGAGKICFDKNGDLCKSLTECNITNFFIDNNLRYDKEPKYSELIKGDKRKFDWKLFVGNSEYYVEYAGIYTDNPRGSLDGNYTKKIKLKINDLTKNGHLNKCLFIYPEDIKTKTLRQIFEPFLGVNLMDVENTYNISTRECFSLTNEQLLEIIMVHSNNQDILPPTSLISNKESGIYSEIIKRFKTYDNFAKRFGKKTLSKNKNKKSAI